MKPPILCLWQPLSRARKGSDFWMKAWKLSRDVVICFCWPLQVSAIKTPRTQVHFQASNASRATLPLKISCKILPRQCLQSHQYPSVRLLLYHARPARICNKRRAVLLAWLLWDMKFCYLPFRGLAISQLQSLAHKQENLLSVSTLEQYFEHRTGDARA